MSTRDTLFEIAIGLITVVVVIAWLGYLIIGF